MFSTVDKDVARLLSSVPPKAMFNIYGRTKNLKMKYIILKWFYVRPYATYANSAALKYVLNSETFTGKHIRDFFLLFSTGLLRKILKLLGKLTTHTVRSFRNKMSLHRPCIYDLLRLQGIATFPPGFFFKRKSDLISHKKQSTKITKKI